MDKTSSVLVSKIWFVFLYTAVITSLIMVISTVSFAAKKTAKGSAAIININTADVKALESLPGVGEATAKAIIEGRPYKSVDDLKRVKGMSDKKIQALKGKVSVGEAAASTATAAGKSVSKKPSKAAKKLTPGQRININSASKEDLQALPGIGPSKAQAIIDGRPYDKAEDIMKVKGIKQKTFDKLKDYIIVK
jgi:competence protein ComEA